MGTHYQFIDFMILQLALKFDNTVDLIIDNIRPCKIIFQLISSHLFSELILEENKLSSLPETLALVEGLKHLNVSCNLLEMVPEVIYSLPSIQHINLAGNNIKGK